MRKVLIMMTLAAISAWGADQFQPLHVKTGLWHATTTITTHGDFQLPADMLARLTPEQRARYEAETRAASPGDTTTRTQESCVQTTDLDNGTMFNPDDKVCTEKVLKSTSSKLDVAIDCHYDNMISKALISLEAIGSEAVKGTGTTTITSGGHSMTSKTDFNARWLSPICPAGK